LRESPKIGICTDAHDIEPQEEADYIFVTLSGSFVA
jgi:hypothetical protein